MTILEIKTAIANYFDESVANLTVNGQDLALVALNQVRRQAELQYDFEFSRRLAQLTVDGVTGGSLNSAVLYSDGVTAVSIKSVIDVGLFDDDGNLRPVEWTTVTESLERQRLDNRRTVPRYRTDDWVGTMPRGLGRFDFTGDTVFRWPKDTTNDFTIGMEVYAFASDWTTSSNTATVTGIDTVGLTGGNTTYTQIAMLNSRPVYYALVGTGVAFVIYNDGTNWLVTLGNYLGATKVQLDAASNGHWFVASTAAFPPGAFAGAQGYAGDAIAVTTTSTDSTSDTWTTYAPQFLQWGAIVHLNHLFKHFVFRQEGNLPPPEKLRDEGLKAFIDWDTNKYEQFRRHGR